MNKGFMIYVFRASGYLAACAIFLTVAKLLLFRSFAVAQIIAALIAILFFGRLLRRCFYEIA